jgi:hypothetical protein
MLIRMTVELVQLSNAPRLPRGIPDNRWSLLVIKNGVCSNYSIITLILFYYIGLYPIPLYPLGSLNQINVTDSTRTLDEFVRAEFCKLVALTGFFACCK